MKEKCKIPVKSIMAEPNQVCMSGKAFPEEEPLLWRPKLLGTFQLLVSFVGVWACLMSPRLGSQEK